MELKTNIQEINGTFYVRIPAAFVDFYKIKKSKDVKIKDISENIVEIIFPVW